MKISAVLLAGGESRRMGQDKATMLFDGAPLWQKQLELLHTLAPQEIFVSARSDPPWRPSDIAFVRDEPPSRGPLSGIAAVMTRMATDYLLALAIDMPFMTPNYLRRLGQQLEAGRGTIPVVENRFEPLAAIYPRTASAELTGALAGDNFSLQPLVAKLIAAGKLQALQVSPEERALFRNLNEPVDLDAG